MSIAEHWEDALKNTTIVRLRARALETFESTDLPYVFLSESAVNVGDTVSRKGEITVEKPALLLPGGSPQFSGFESDQAEFQPDLFTNLLLVRGISLPSLKYNNTTLKIDVIDGKLSGAVKKHRDRLIREENLDTSLLVGPENCWQMSLVIFVAHLVARCAHGDVKRLFETFRRKDRWF